MNWDEIRSIAEHCFETGIENMTRDGMVKPTYFIVTAEGISVIPVEHRFSGERSRRAAAMAMQKIARERGASAVMLISDTGYAKPESSGNTDTPPPPSQGGEADMLTLNIGLPDGRGNLLTGRIIRDAGGKPVEVREGVWVYPEPSLTGKTAMVILSWEEGASGTLH